VSETQSVVQPVTEPKAPMRRILGMTILVLGALVFLFPFYYMIVGALQEVRDPTLSGAIPWPSNLTLANFLDINEAINLGRSLLNSGIFSVVVVLCTIVFGVLAGYAMATLHFRGRGILFAVVLLLQAVPFQLLMVPLYVMLVRSFGLADTYTGMILPFAINSVAVLIFRQFFVQVPREMFEAARIDGASEFRILRSIAVPLVRPAILTASLVTFIGPWNEFLWPFLITKHSRACSRSRWRLPTSPRQEPRSTPTPWGPSWPAPLCLPFPRSCFSLSSSGISQPPMQRPG